MEFKDIPVVIEAQEHRFDFFPEENNRYGMFCRITSEGKELFTDEDFTTFKGDMPESWIQPAINKLILLLKANSHQDGQLN